MTQPNFEAMNAALDASRESIPNVVDNHRLVVEEVKLLQNIPVFDIQEQLRVLIRGQVAMQRGQARLRREVREDFRKMKDEMRARDQNRLARLENAKVHKGAEELEPMFCVNPDFDEVSVNELIPRFPATRAEVEDLNGKNCRSILSALGQPVLPVRTPLLHLQKQVGKIIGVTSVW